jgi:hypothetical protein
MMKAVRVIEKLLTMQRALCIERGLRMDIVMELRKRDRQVTGGARGTCGLRSAGRMTGLIGTAAVMARAEVERSAIAPCCGAASICAQHCIPQPAAQGQPLS